MLPEFVIYKRFFNVFWKDSKILRL
jgi:hypothetical protein